jgi:U-box domain
MTEKDPLFKCLVITSVLKVQSFSKGPFHMSTQLMFESQTTAIMASTRNVEADIDVEAGSDAIVNDNAAPPSYPEALLLKEQAASLPERPTLGGGLTCTQEYPLVFYDPATDKLMVCPVVNLSGDSFDKSSTTDDSVTYYPNRALAAIIRQETTAASNPPSLRASMRRMDSALKSGWGRMVEKSVFPSNYRPLPDVFYCPVTCELMVDPVIAPDGNSYERDAIKKWICTHGTSPITRETITMNQLRPNNALYKLIQGEKKRTPESMHPSIRRWKESTAETSRRPLTEAASAEETEEFGCVGACVFLLAFLFTIAVIAFFVPFITAATALAMFDCLCCSWIGNNDEDEESEQMH